jgi:3-oxoacyl-[acyl-carrier-protein] synthase I
MYPLQLSSFTMASCLGLGVEPTLGMLVEGRGALSPLTIESDGLQTFIGEVATLGAVPLPAPWRKWDCRNNRLAFVALQQDRFGEAVARAAARYGADRVGVFIGTSTSGIRETEDAYARQGEDRQLPQEFSYRHTHAAFATAEFVRSVLGLRGPATSISTACSSSAKVFPAAARMIAAGIIDAAVVGGVDSLCRTTLFGFRSLELLSSQPCRPFDADRAGLSLGEAGAFVLLEGISGERAADDILLLGAGESSDAYHMSSPHPEGLGARMAIEAALRSAQLPASEIDYVNLHGTGTRTNDLAEDKAVCALLGERVACSSTKGVTGHTLGAAGAVEAVICALALQSQVVPGGVTTSRQDPLLACRFLRAPQPGRLRKVLSNSFGFGGTNCALVFGTAAR